MSRTCNIGIDWGGTRTKIGAVARDGTLVASTIHDSPRSDSIDTIIDGLCDTTATFIDSLDHAVEAIGLALTGPVNPELGVVLLPGKVAGLEGYPIVPRFRERFHCPVRATNDGLAALHAEKYLGHARDKQYAVSVTLGTGVGSGVMIEGRIPHDPHFLFGLQLGHLVMDLSDDRLCLTGARGTGELNCSATALALAVRSGLQRGIPSTLGDLYWEDPHAIDFQTIIERGVEQDDALSIDELARWTRRLGWLLVNAVHAYSPEVIILSGGCTHAARHFLPDVQEHVNTHVFRYPPGEPVPIVLSELSAHAGVLGAAMMMQS